MGEYLHILYVSKELHRGLSHVTIKYSIQSNIFAKKPDVQGLSYMMYELVDKPSIYCPASDVLGLMACSTTSRSG